jgi:hypothetical protein
MKELKFIKRSGLLLIIIGFISTILTTLYMVGHERELLSDIVLNNKLVMFKVISIGFILVGGLLRLYSSKYE